MKYISALILFCVFLCPASGNAAASDSTCSIKGHIKGLGHHRIIFSYFPDLNSYHADTVWTSHGHFVYTTHMNEPTDFHVAALRNHPHKKPLFAGEILRYVGRTGRKYPLMMDVLLENRTMTWDANLRTFMKMDIKNAPMNDTFRAIRQITSHIYSTDPAWSHWRKNHTHIWSNHLSATSMIERDSILEQAYKREGDSVAAYIIAHPCSFPSAWSIWRVMRTDHAVMQAAYDALDTSLRHIWTVQSYKKRMDRVAGSLAVGDRIPDITLADTAGKMVTLSSVQGKLTLVDFWASWCGPCRSENPNVVAAYKKFHKKGFEIYSISLDNVKASWVRAIAKDKLSWTQVSDLQGWENKYTKQFGVTGIPGNFLIDQNGKVIAKNLKGSALLAALSGMLR